MPTKTKQFSPLQYIIYFNVQYLYIDVGGGNGMLFIYYFF